MRCDAAPVIALGLTGRNGITSPNAFSSTPLLYGTLLAAGDVGLVARKLDVRFTYLVVITTD